MRKAAPLASMIALAALISACASTPDALDVPEPRPLLKQEAAQIDVEKTLVSAQDMMAQEQFRRAAALYANILLHKPKHVEARIGAGNAALALGEGEAAYAIFSKLQDRDDNETPPVKIGYILASVMTARSENPESLINDGLELQVEDSRLWNVKGRFHDEREDWLAAQDCYVQALTIGQGPSSALNNMGLSLMQQGRFVEAVDKFEQAIDLNPRKPLYDNNRRMALMLDGRLHMALSDLPGERAAELLNDAGYIALQQNRYDRAVALLSRALETSPVYFEAAAENLALARSRAQTGLQTSPKLQSVENVEDLGGSAGL